MKAIAKMKPDIEQTVKLESLYKVESVCKLNSWPIAQLVRACEWNSVVVGPNPIQANFL